MFHNMMITSLTPLSNTKEMTSGWENRPFTGTWPEDNKSVEIKRPIQKKRKRIRAALTTQQILAIEYFYCKKRFINAREREQLANSTNLTVRCAKIWFQNKRKKEKKSNSDFTSDSIRNNTCSSSEDSISNEVCSSSEVLPPTLYSSTSTDNSQ